MGMCFPCFKVSSTDLVTPDMETRRRQQIQAAERRMREQESRGIKDPERFKHQQLKKEECERRQEEAQKASTGARGGGLKWQVD
ncbi:small VCP/p97-interacting protein [Zootermopsis nevadensis]|uniref:Small VCP/p97-interacting protein n=1 Tax=Zootermopsis nevadensis TaxID=136037 RepID=A0A067QZ65_ZOONE|nr:small VCP/p97-interacting protein [Zootermopsis nevadensis]KDR15703.1 Small VCP/p97-interacting protein [Zootermopsis nevadensis]